MSQLACSRGLATKAERMRGEQRGASAIHAAPWEACRVPNGWTRSQYDRGKARIDTPAQSPSVGVASPPWLSYRCCREMAAAPYVERQGCRTSPDCLLTPPHPMRASPLPFRTAHSTGRPLGTTGTSAWTRLSPSCPTCGTRAGTCPAASTTGPRTRARSLRRAALARAGRRQTLCLREAARSDARPARAG